MRDWWKFAIVVSIATATGAAEAMTTDVVLMAPQQNVYVNGSLSGSFDLSSVLGTTKRAVAGTVTARFDDDGDLAYLWTSDTGFKYVGSGRRNCGFFSGCDYYSRYERYITDYFYDSPDSAKLSAGTSSVAVGSSYFVDPDDYASSANVVYESGSTRWSSYEVTFSRDYRYGYSGNFSAPLVLSVIDIDAANTNQVVGFVVDALFGSDFILSDVTLALTIEDIPATVVPVPAPAVMMLSAIGAFGVLRRRRRSP